MSALLKIQQSGFDLSLDDQHRLVVKPASRITEKLRQYLKANKPVIIAELQAKLNPAKYQYFTVTHNNGKVYESTTGELMSVSQFRELFVEFIDVIPFSPLARHHAIDEKDESAILSWLESIGETDQEIIEEVLEKCRTNKDALEYFLDTANHSQSRF